MLSPCLFNWYAQNIMWNAGWDGAQAGIKISCRNNNSLRYTDDTILMEEREEELRVSWWKWKRRVKSCLKTQHSKNEVYGIQYHHFMKTDGETFSFLGSKITADGNWSHKIKKKKKKLLLWKKSLTNLDSGDITLPTKLCIVKAMVFLVVVYGCESWMWEGWMLKNWCFWTVVLEKILESPLDCKEIQPVNPKGNQSWIFIGRADAEAEAPLFDHLMGRDDLLEKTLMLGNIEGRRRRG